MTYSGQPNKQQPPQGTDDNRVFYTYNYGGLNVESPSVNTPPEDSPYMLNMDVTLSGLLRKRYGSTLRDTSVTGLSGYPAFCVPVELPNTGVITIWTKLNGTVYGRVQPQKESIDPQINLWTLPNVFGVAAYSDIPNYIVTAEESPRLIMVTPNNVPVEIEFTYSSGIGEDSTVLEKLGDLTDQLSTDRGYIIWIDPDNGVVRYSKLLTLAYDSVTNVSTLTFTHAVPTDVPYDIVSTNFHWWAESIKRTKAQVFDTALRFNTSLQADVNVQVPTEIRRGLFADYVAFDRVPTNQMPCVIFNANASGASPRTWDINPSSDTEYAWSNLQYIDAGGNVNLGSTYITFGGITGTGTDPATPVNFVRVHYLPFNGGNGILGADLYVRDSEGEWTWASTGVPSTVTPKLYYGGSASTVISRINSSTPSTLLFGIRFDGSVPFGITEEFVEVSNSASPTDFSGTSSSSTYYSKVVYGSFKPVYGISEYSNYSSGAFPSVIGLYQDRIVLGGFPSNPLLLLLSNQGDFGSTLRYQNFQIYMEDSSYAQNPIEIVLTSSGNDYITGVSTWFDSLFVFSKLRVRQVKGDSSDLVITPTNKSSLDVASVGCESQHLVRSTDRYLYFLSDSDLFRIDILADTGNYVVTPISLKISTIIRERKNKKVGWLAFNSKDALLYLGIPDAYDVSVCQRLLVYNIQMEAWTEYALFDGYMTSSYGCCFKDRLFVNLLVRSNDLDVPEGDDGRMFLTEFNIQSRYIDLARELSQYQYRIGSNISIYGLYAASITINVTQQKRLKVDKSEFNPRGFKLIPLNELDSAFVLYYQGSSPTLLTFGTDYRIDAQKNSIYFNTYPWNPLDTVNVRLNDSEGNYPVAVYIDNVKQEQGTDYNVVSVATYYAIANLRVDETNLASSIVAGYVYPSYHSSPTFTREAGLKEKRVTRYLGYYSNKKYSNAFNYSDVNVAVNQDETELVDKYKINAEVSVAFLYNDTNYGFVSSDIYRTGQIVWDVDLFDAVSSPLQDYDVVRLVEPILGLAYSFSVLNFSFNDATFELVGYQVDSITKGNSRRYYF
jgi:hypothetical protein